MPVRGVQAGIYVYAIREMDKRSGPGIGFGLRGWREKER
jgi:hypothetical protein